MAQPQLLQPPLPAAGHAPTNITVLVTNPCLSPAVPTTSVHTEPSGALQAAGGVCNFPPFFASGKTAACQVSPVCPPCVSARPCAAQRGGGDIYVFWNPCQRQHALLSGSRGLLAAFWAGRTGSLSVASWASSHLCTLLWLQQGGPDPLTSSLGAQCQLPDAKKSQQVQCSKGCLGHGHE